MRKLMLVSTILIIMGLALVACAQTDQLTAATDTPQGSTPTSPPAATAIPTQQLTQQPTQPPVSNEKPPFDLTQIIAAVASQAKVPVDQVNLTDWQPVNWRDSCLGVHDPGVACADVITPGYVLTFHVGDAVYVVHTDATGKNFRLANDKGPLDQLPAVSWTRSGGIAGICQNLTIYSTGNYWLRDCNRSQVLAQGVLTETQMTELKGLWDKYGTFEWNLVNPAGAADMFNEQIKFFGRGTATMTADEQQKLSQTLAQLANELASTSSAGDTSGITGQVMIGPTCGGPVGNNSTECADKPYPTSITVLDQSGITVTQFTTDAEGRFRVPLQPGQYTLHPASTGKLPAAVDQQIQVISGQYLTVSITYDSGMR